MGAEKGGCTGWPLGAEKACWATWPVGTEEDCGAGSGEKLCCVSWPLCAKKDCDAICPDEAEKEGEDWATGGAEKFCWEVILGNGAGGRMSARISVSCCGVDKS